MSKTIETTYRNGCIQLPDDVHLAEDTRVTVILPDNAMPKAGSHDTIVVSWTFPSPAIRFRQVDRVDAEPTHSEDSQ